MRYLVLGPSIINDIEHEDGRVQKCIIGGSIFCVAGIKLWADDCIFISNVGSDFRKYYGRWMDDNNCAYYGLNEILPHTQYTRLIYDKNGLHDEVSIYGRQEEELVNKIDRYDIDRILKFCNAETNGMYIEANVFDEIWDSIEKIKSKNNIKIMWELPTSVSLKKERREKAFEIIGKVDIYSINLPEAQCLFNAGNEEDAIKEIIKLQKPCYFRVGKKGSYMIRDGKSYFSESAVLGEVIDTTGCGNCSTSAALAGFCRDYAPEKIAKMGNITAAYNLLQYGPYPNVVQVRDKALKLLEQHKMRRQI